MSYQVIEAIARKLGIKAEEVQVGHVVDSASQRLTELTHKLDTIALALRQIHLDLHEVERSATRARQLSLESDAKEQQ